MGIQHFGSDFSFPKEEWQFINAACLGENDVENSNCDGLEQWSRMMRYRESISKSPNLTPLQESSLATLLPRSVLRHLSKVANARSTGCSAGTMMTFEIGAMKWGEHSDTENTDAKLTIPFNLK